MANGQKSMTQRLQEALDEVGQLRHELARTEGLEEENASLRERLDIAEAELDSDRGVSQSERRRYEERIREAEASVASWTQRAVAAENLTRQQAALLQEIKSLVVGRECVLPQIARLFGG